MTTLTSEAESERRRHRRQPSHISIRYGSAKAFLSAYTENISASGVFIATDQVLPPGTSLEVEVLFPGLTEPIRLKGIVRWAVVNPASGQKKGIGVEFIPDVLTDASSGVAVP